MPLAGRHPFGLFEEGTRTVEVAGPDARARECHGLGRLEGFTGAAGLAERVGDAAGRQVGYDRERDAERGFIVAGAQGTGSFDAAV